MKNRGPPVAQILHPAALHFKEGRVLANHPLICHHQGVFGCPESAKKMRESEEKKKRAGKRELKASQKFIARLIDVYKP